MKLLGRNDKQYLSTTSPRPKTTIAFKWGHGPAATRGRP
ncbi:uncharacterized protein FTOL_13757 [Fusarium torulosum]|uniref:Uncharacterized protein n=1 Tax=Fusarium torulosum TaxID=33205 RepID=A0AAE8SQ59_9HYPO|nr:uncharacterized protein FTOL_13757 [Fusarium torulosum]